MSGRWGAGGFGKGVFRANQRKGPESLNLWATAAFPEEGRRPESPDKERGIEPDGLACQIPVQ